MATQATKTTRKTCTVCKKRFQARMSTIMTCSDTCKDIRRSGKQRKAQTPQKTRAPRKPKAAPISNVFIQLLIRHIRYAGTVQILEGADKEALLELLAMSRMQNRINTSYASDQFHFSHIYPVKGQAGIGKLTPDNVVLAPAKLNQSHGTTHYGHGSYIAPEARNLRLLVNSHHTDAEIIQLLTSMVGEDVFQSFLRAAQLQPSQRQKYLDTLLPLLSRSNSAHDDYFKVLDNNPSTFQIRSILEAVQGDTVYSAHTEYLGEQDVLLSELERVSSAYRPDLQGVCHQLHEAAQLFSDRQAKDIDFEEFELGFVFDILHGKALSPTLIEAFQDILDRAKALKPRSTIVYTPRLAIPAPAPTAPVILETIPVPAFMLPVLTPDVLIDDGSLPF
jgi:hypothetical protein